MKRPAVTELMKLLREYASASHGMELLGCDMEEATGLEVAKLLLTLATAVVTTLLTTLADGDALYGVELYVVMNDMSGVQRSWGERSSRRNHGSISVCAIYYGGGGTTVGQAPPAGTESISLVGYVYSTADKANTERT